MGQQQQNDHLLYQQQQQQRALRQQQQLVHVQQQISVPPHPSQFSNPQIYKPILDTSAHPQFASMASPRNIQTAQQHLTSPNSHQQQFQHQAAQRNASYVVNNGQAHQQPILIYDKNANQPQLQPMNVNNALHRSSSLTLSHQSSNGSLPSLQPGQIEGFAQRFSSNNGHALSSQVQHIQNINNLHLQQQQQIDSHLIQNNHQILQ